jgi:hypothetical protein
MWVKSNTVVGLVLFVTPLQQLREHILEKTHPIEKEEMEGKSPVPVRW